MLVTSNMTETNNTRDDHLVTHDLPLRAGFDSNKPLHIYIYIKKYIFRKKVVKRETITRK